MKIKDIVQAIDAWAPFSLQESYDNSGLIIGSPEQEVDTVLVCFDVTEEVVQEAVEKKAQLILAHHPPIFKGLKRLTGSSYVERVAINAIRHNIGILAVHTNLDNVLHGTNSILADKLGLVNVQALSPMKEQLYKLVTFVPEAHADRVRTTLFNAGAGHIGNYDSCSYNSKGQGSFRAGNDSNPYVGEHGELHFEDEVRIEVIFPRHVQSRMIRNLLDAHPYEEVAYDIYPLMNQHKGLGAGIIGELKEAQPSMDFLYQLKNTLNAQCIKHTKPVRDHIQRVAICGGSGAFLIGAAKAAKADIYISGDIKYHEFFDAEDKLIIADTGHYESEQFTKELLISHISEKFPTFAVLKSEIDTNPVNYLYTTT